MISPEERIDRGRYLATADKITLADAVPMNDFNALRAFCNWQTKELEKLRSQLAVELSALASKVKAGELVVWPE